MSGSGASGIYSGTLADSLCNRSCADSSTLSSNCCCCCCELGMFVIRTPGEGRSFGVGEAKGRSVWAEETPATTQTTKTIRTNGWRKIVILRCKSPKYDAHANYAGRRECNAPPGSTVGINDRRQ